MRLCLCGSPNKKMLDCNFLHITSPLTSPCIVVEHVCINNNFINLIRRAPAPVILVGNRQDIFCDYCLSPFLAYYLHFEATTGNDV